MINLAGLSKVIEEILTLCKVKPDEKAILLTPTKYDEALIQEFMVALANKETDFLRIIAPTRDKNKKLIPSATQPLGMEVFKAADIVLEVKPWQAWEAEVPSAKELYSDVANEIFASGTRWLDFSLPFPEINIRRLFPSQKLIKRTWAGAELMEKAKEIKIVSETGTNFTCRKDGRKGGSQNGLVPGPGEWDNYGFGMVDCAPLEDSSEGVIVVSPGDHYHYDNSTERVNIVREPIKLIFKDGKIAKIEGGLEAKLISRSLARYNNDDVYRIAHIGWGTHEGCVWTDNRLFCIADVESYLGNVQIHFGINIFNCPAPHKGLGGKNRAPAHVSGPSLLNHDFYLDGELIVKKGKIVHPECI